MTPLDIHNNILVNQHIQKIDIAFFQKIEYFCCHYQDIEGMPEELLSVIKPHPKTTVPKTTVPKMTVPKMTVRKMAVQKKKETETKRSVTDLMIGYRLNHSKDNKERSYRTARTNILDFRKFLVESKIPDEITSMTKGIAASYAEWLKKKNISVNTANQRIRALATNLRNLTTIVELDFSYPLPEKLPLLEKNLTGDEMEENDIALTEEQVMAIYELQNLTGNEAIARDMFCLQCWTGVRVSDIPQLLDSKNLEEIEGCPFSIFRPKKTQNNKKLRAQIPLSTLYPDAYTLVRKYIDNCPQLVLGKKNEYNDAIRSICKQAGLNEIRTKTVEAGGRKTSEQKQLWELVSSHKGRHTFVSNCKKRGIPEEQIILMTAHTTTAQIKQTYDNTDATDNAKLLLQALSDISRTEQIPANPPGFRPCSSIAKSFESAWRRCWRKCQSRRLSSTDYKKEAEDYFQVW